MGMQVSRRGILGMLSAGAAAAIVRPGLIMPIKPQLVVSPVGLYITADMIATAFAQELYKAGSRRVICGLPKQSHVDLRITTHHRTLPLDQFVERYLRPAAVALSTHCKGIGGPLELPKGVESALGFSGGFAVRYVEHYSLHDDKLITRFDVINS